MGKEGGKEQYRKVGEKGERIHTWFTFDKKKWTYVKKGGRSEDWRDKEEVQSLYRWIDKEFLCKKWRFRPCDEITL